VDDVEDSLLGIESVFLSFSDGVDVDEFGGFLFDLFFGDS
jgi:hypothetical protein